MDEINKLIENSKKNFISLDISSFYDYLDNLSLLDELALFYIIILTSLISIGFNITSVFFGNEIIIYFNLEQKFPRLAFFFRLRSQFQKYYLIINLSLLFIILPKN